MGLSISVGVLADLKRNDSEGAERIRDEFEKVQRLLREAGHAGWQEPEDLEDLRLRPHVGSFPYSFLHVLRRAYAWAVRRPDTPLEPAAPDAPTAEDDQLIESEAMMMESHLLCHSDSEGFYVPVDLPEPLFDVGGSGVTGGMVGSSQGLMRELERMAPLLGIRLGPAGALSDEEARRVYEEGTDEGHPFWREKLVWLTLYECARASVAHRAALCFG